MELVRRFRWCIQMVLIWIDCSTYSCHLADHSVDAKGIRIIFHPALCICVFVVLCVPRFDAKYDKSRYRSTIVVCIALTCTLAMCVFSMYMNCCSFALCMVFFIFLILFGYFFARDRYQRQPPMK